MIHIPNPHVPHLLLKNKFPKISLCRITLSSPLCFSHLFHWTKCQPLHLRLRSRSYSATSPMLSTTPGTNCVFAWMFITWIKWVDEYSISEIQHQAQWKYCKNVSSSWKSTRILTPLSGKVKDSQIVPVPISHAHPVLLALDLWLNSSDHSLLDYLFLTGPRQLLTVPLLLPV